MTEIAKELHLDETKVRALEQNDFETLGAPVFAKGHLKKYAAIVGVETDDVLADYHRLNRSTGAPPFISSRQKPQRNPLVVPWILAVVIVVAAILGWWLFGPDDSSNSGADSIGLPGEPAAVTPSDTGPSSTPSSAPSSAASPDAAVDDDPGEDPDGDRETAEPASAGAPGGGLEIPAVSAGVDPAAEPPPAGGEARLSLRFTGDCWTEISDAGGRRLFFDLGRGGRTVTLNGEAPFAVLFGNADNVELSVDGVAYPIPAASRRGQTARLTIDRP